MLNGLTPLKARETLHVGGSRDWSPARLFSNGEKGAWYEPASMWSLFQDAARTTPVTGISQPVGSMLDLSPNMSHVVQTTSAQRPVLSALGSVLFDGVDDGLRTENTMDMSAISSATVVCAIYKNSDAALGSVVEFGPTIATTAGFNLNAPSAAASTSVAAGHRGATFNRSATGVLGAAPKAGVLACVSDLITPSLILRVNGAVSATSVLTTGGGTYGNQTMYMGRRAGSTLPFNGILYGLVVVGRILTSIELALLESYFNRKAGAY